jgi:hypothetical protein
MIKPGNAQPFIEREFMDFGVRQSRPEFVLSKFPEVFTGTVLDIGSDAGVIKGRLGDENVTGIDLNPSADILLNLDEVERLPFEDGKFSAVLCLDVLEHLENLHRMAGEAIRVSSQFVLISLPNPWSLARLRLARGNGSIPHYGLPDDPPEDRHRWFFSYLEALRYLSGLQSGSLRIRRLMTVEKAVVSPIRWFRQLLYFDPDRYRNRYVHTLMCLLEKQDNGW